jgi:hypothetical protein
VANCAADPCTNLEEAAIYASAILVGASTDVVDAPDVASIAGVTIDVGNENAANGQLDAAANRVLAVVFTVQVQ